MANVFQSKLEQDAQMKQYFHTLPKFVQETVKQSGAQIETKEDLQKCAENLMKKGY